MTDGAALKIETRFEVIYCCTCSCAFAVPAHVRAAWLENGETFFCPRGHSQHYSESELTKVQRALEAERERKQRALEDANRERALRQQAEQRLAAQKGVATKLRKRVANGVCPCCTRSFANLQRHMSAKHPDYLIDGC